MTILRGRGTGRWLVPFAALSAAVVISGVLWPAHTVSPNLRDGIETAITLAALAGACLLAAEFRRTGRLRDLLLLGALGAVSLGDFLFSVLPAVAHVETASPHPGSAAGLLWQSLVSWAFLAAMIAPCRGTTRRGRRWLALAAATAAGVVALVAVLADAEPIADGSHLPSGLYAAAQHPLALIVSVACAVVLGIAAVGFARQAREDPTARLLAGAAVVLAGVRLTYLAFPAVGPDWITPGVLLRVVGYALLLWAAFEQLARARASDWAVISGERRRIARDLHDGLAQDLAFIATHGRRFASELGPDHPLTIAARRALSTTRAAIMDLSAPEAPSLESALEDVASELQARFAVPVEVKAADPAELEPRDRDQIVGIVREAVVNAVRHGGARHVRVALDSRGAPFHLTVMDDGSGIAAPVSAPSDHHGFGLAGMRARAESLGGTLVARAGARGGTEIELLVS